LLLVLLGMSVLLSMVLLGLRGRLLLRVRVRVLVRRRRKRLVLNRRRLLVMALVMRMARMGRRLRGRLLLILRAHRLMRHAWSAGVGCRRVGMSMYIVGGDASWWRASEDHRC
jgi:hypothetical protein